MILDCIITTYIRRYLITQEKNIFNSKTKVYVKSLYFPFGAELPSLHYSVLVNFRVDRITCEETPHVYEFRLPITADTTDGLCFSRFVNVRGWGKEGREEDGVICDCEVTEM